MIALSDEKPQLKSNQGMLIPCVDSEGVWLCAGSLALRQSLIAGQFVEANELLHNCNIEELGIVLSQNGFGSPAGLEQSDLVNLLFEVQRDITEAAAMHVDGFGLDALRAEKNQNWISMHNRNLHEYALNGIDNREKDIFGDIDFISDKNAAVLIQKVLQSKAVDVVMLGNKSPNLRGTMLFIAAQALQKHVQGFAFDGIEGKYAVAMSMSELSELHSHAAKAVAESSARFALGEWVDSKKISPISEWVPDSVSQLYRGTLTVKSAASVINAIQSGSIALHAEKIGAHLFARIMNENGYDVNLDTVEQQAVKQSLVIVTPDKNRGDYSGPVVGFDHKSYLVKVAREKALSISKTDFSEFVDKPNMGDELRIKYKDGSILIDSIDRRNKQLDR